MNFLSAQKDMQASFTHGAPGVLVSGLVWLIAGMIAKFHVFNYSLIALFIGGMFIYPLSVLISRQIYKSAPPQKTNPLMKLALEGTFLLFVGLFFVFIMATTKPDLCYPIMLMVIGARYLTFQTIYGLKTYWVLGGVLLTVGFVSIYFVTLKPYLVPLLGGSIEVIFSVYLFALHKKLNTPA